MNSRLARVIDVFEADAARLAHAQAQAVRARFSAYRAGRVPEAILVASGRHNVEQVTAILRSGRPPERAALDEARRTRERVSQGVPADEMHDAYRLCLRILGEAFVSTASAIRLQQNEILAATRLLWESADVLTSAVVLARQAAERSQASHGRDARAAFLRELVHGIIDPRAIPEQAALFGLSIERGYYALRARARQPSQHDALETRLAQSAHSQVGRPLLARLDGDVVGIVARQPVLDDPRFTVGIGGPVTLDAMPRAFATASRMLDVALAYGLNGAFELGDLTLRVAVTAEPELGALLVERYLAPLVAQGDFGAALEQTLRMHLRCGGHINATADSLGLHVNTVRHRLARVEQLTGACLDELPTQMEIWWALSWSDHAPRTAGD